MIGRVPPNCGSRQSRRRMDFGSRNSHGRQKLLLFTTMSWDALSACWDTTRTRRDTCCRHFAWTRNSTDQKAWIWSSWRDLTTHGATTRALRLSSIRSCQGWMKLRKQILLLTLRYSMRRHRFTKTLVRIVGLRNSTQKLKSSLLFIRMHGLRMITVGHLTKMPHGNSKLSYLTSLSNHVLQRARRERRGCNRCVP
jgi:hypothetical protein